MSKLSQVLSPARSLCQAPGTSKKRVLEQAAHLLAGGLQDLPAQSVFEALLAREKLGSTGFGGGVALPHCRLTGCTAPIGALLQLAQAVDFDAIDGASVDLLFVLLVPQNAIDVHLQLLRQIAAKLSQSGLCERLRRAKTGVELHQIVCQTEEDQCT